MTTRRLKLTPTPDPATPDLGHLAGALDRPVTITLTVVPLVAAHYLRPGTHVGYASDGVRACISGNPIGLVDPYLRDPVKEGQRFWCFLFPAEES